MFPALPRFDECARDVVEHALRIVVKCTRYNNYVYPVTHSASAATNTSANLPAKGQRLRLKVSFDTPASWTKQESALLLALKKYGALVADNGNLFSPLRDARRPLAGGLFQAFHQHRHNVI